LQQFKEHLDPAVAIREQAEGFVKAVIWGTAEDVQRGAHGEYYHSMSHDGSEEPLPLTPPLKRHVTLQPLSREHMGGLIQARSLRQAADRERPKRLLAIAGFLDAWRSEIRAHFDDEERLLLPLVHSPALRDRLLDEHGTLRRLAEECERDPEAVASDAELVRRIGVLLHDHIRWEEREFFETVQRDHPEALTGLASEAAFIEEQRPGSRARHRLGVDEHDTGRNEAEP
jgi:hemerythrin-like domain-containing protein